MTTLRLRVPGDKSISHRSLLFGALASGTTRISGLLEAEDVGRTLRAVQQLGCDASTTHVTGAPWRGAGVIDCGNSGTTARLLLGALAPRAWAVLEGDASLSRRPMKRVMEPLTRMGARFEGGPSLPVSVHPSALIGITHTAVVASAQVKTAILLAGLAASSETAYIEPLPTRDHTERMLAGMGAALRIGDGAIVITPGPLSAVEIAVPGDISSAAFWLVAAAITPGSDVVVEGVGLNPTRTGVVNVLRRMGADVTVEHHGGIEPIGDIRVRGRGLVGTEIGGAEVPTLIDEIPVLAVAAAFAEGETLIRDAGELRVKESDRIAATVAGLHVIGVEAETLPDGMRIRGGIGRAPANGTVESEGDHRIAMAFTIASLHVPVDVRNVACIATSYPAFAADFAYVRGAIGGRRG